MINILLYGLTIISYGSLSVLLWRSYTSLNKYQKNSDANFTARKLFSKERNKLNRQSADKSADQNTNEKVNFSVASINLQTTAELKLPEQIHQNRLSNCERIILTAALFCHGLLLDQIIFPNGLMVFGFAYAISAMFWLGLAIYWVETFFFSIRSMALILFPAALLAVLLPTLFDGMSVMKYAIGYLFKAHFIIAIIAYGFFGIAALHALLMLFVEHQLHGHRRFHHFHRFHPSAAQIDNTLAFQEHSHKLSSTYQRQTLISNGNPWFQSSIFLFFKSIWNLILITLPPLLTMEKLLFRLILAGFVMLSATLISGGLVQKYAMHNWFEWNEKTIFSILSWLMFAFLLIGRQWRGWRGRTALHWTLIAYALLLLAYVGSRFIFEVWLQNGGV